MERNGLGGFAPFFKTKRNGEHEQTMDGKTEYRFVDRSRVGVHSRIYPIADGGGAVS
jgi:hypothetical protein